MKALQEQEFSLGICFQGCAGCLMACVNIGCSKDIMLCGIRVFLWGELIALISKTLLLQNGWSLPVFAGCRLPEVAAHVVMHM